MVGEFSAVGSDVGNALNPARGELGGRGEVIYGLLLCRGHDALREDGETAGERGLLGFVDVKRVTFARDALIEVAGQELQPALLGVKGGGQRGEIGEIGEMILPAPTVFLARVHVGTGPGDAEAVDAEQAQGGAGFAIDVAARRHGARTVIDNGAPRPFAPQEDLAPAGYDGVAGIFFAGDRAAGTRLAAIPKWSVSFRPSGAMLEML